MQWRIGSPTVKPDTLKYHDETSAADLGGRRETCDLSYSTHSHGQIHSEQNPDSPQAYGVFRTPYGVPASSYEVAVD